MVGSTRPFLKDLHGRVVSLVAHKWKDLGVQLLGQDQQNELNIIAADCPGDSRECCKRVFEIWLNTTADNATWDQLIAALRSVGLNYFASELNESMRNTECKIYSLFTILCCKASNGCGTSEGSDTYVRDL